MAQGMGMGGRGLGGGPRGYLTDEEKKNRPKFDRAMLLRILSYLKPYRVQFVFVFLAILISAVIGLFPSIITGRIVDQALVGKNMQLLIQLLLLALVTLTASQAIGVLQSYINSWISQRIIFDMQNQMYQHLQQMPHSFYTNEKQGDILTRMESDISGVGTVITNTLTTSVSNIAVMIATLTALFTMNWKMALVGIAIIPMTLIPARTVGKTRWKLLTDVQNERDKMNQLITETLSVSGSMLMKLFTREKSEYDRFVSVNDSVTRLSLKEQRSGKWFLMIHRHAFADRPAIDLFHGRLADHLPRRHDADHRYHHGDDRAGQSPLRTGQLTTQPERRLHALARAFSHESSTITIRKSRSRVSQTRSSRTWREPMWNIRM